MQGMDNFLLADELFSDVIASGKYSVSSMVHIDQGQEASKARPTPSTNSSLGIGMSSGGVEANFILSSQFIDASNDHPSTITTCSLQEEYATSDDEPNNLTPPPTQFATSIIESPAVATTNLIDSDNENATDPITERKISGTNSRRTSESSRTTSSTSRGHGFALAASMSQIADQLKPQIPAHHSDIAKALKTIQSNKYSSLSAADKLKSIKVIKDPTNAFIFNELDPDLQENWILDEISHV